MSSRKLENKKLPSLFVGAAAVLWGVLVVFVRNMNAAGLSAMEIVAIRSYGSAMFLLLFIRIWDKSKLGIKLRDAWCFVGTGVFSIVFFSYCYFKNVELSSAALSSILMYTSPVWVTIISYFVFKEKITLQKIICIVMALLGCALVSGIADGIGLVSINSLILGLGSGIGYALYSIFGRLALNRKYASVTVTAYTFLFACFGVLPFVDLRVIIGKLNSNPMLWAWGLGMAFFCTTLSFFLYTLGLKNMDPGSAAVLATLEPIVSTIVGVVYYKETLTIFMIVGIILVLVSSILICKK